jgi:hypothetical protein
MAFSLSCHDIFTSYDYDVTTKEQRGELFEFLSSEFVRKVGKGRE